MTATGDRARDGSAPFDRVLPRDLDPAPPPRTGAIVGGRYVIRDLLGRGGMGVVMLADDPKLHRTIAIKIAGFDPHGPTAIRMRREALAMARVDDPHVLAIYDVGEHDGALFIAMEYAAGGSLGAWLQAAPRSWPDVLAMFVAAGRGLAAAHAHGLVHRDFKPDNVLLDAHGRARVADFGLARALDDAPTGSDAFASLTATGAALGTPAYMPPEQYGGIVDARADQFSFCVALWEGLYGERPFAAASVPALLFAVTEGRIRSPARDRGVPSAIEAVLRRGLSAKPDDRYASMPILLGALARAGRSQPRRAVVIALGGLAIVVLGGIAIVTALWATADRDAAGAAPIFDGSDDASSRSISPDRDADIREAAPSRDGHGHAEKRDGSPSAVADPGVPLDADSTIASWLHRAESAAAHLGAGEIDRARDELQVVIDELEQRLGKDDVRLVRPLKLLGDAHAAESAFDQSHAAYARAVRILQLRLPRNDPAVLQMRALAEDADRSARQTRARPR